MTGRRLFGHFVLPKTGTNVGLFLIVAEKRIEELIALHRPRRLIYEAPLLNAKRDNVLKLQKLYGLANEVEKAATRHQLPCLSELLGTIRTHFLGKDFPRQSEKIKILTKVKARDMGYDVDTDDEADAIALLDYILSLDRPALAMQAKPLLAGRV